MKQKDNQTPKQGHSANMLLYAVAPQPKLSTDAIALDGAVVSRGNGIGATSETYLMDCIVGMKQYPDKYFDLAVVDPPYGIGIHKMNYTQNTKGGVAKRKDYSSVTDWDANVPSIEYFIELMRVSKNQVIWGGNYFDLPQTKSWIVWDKRTDDKYSNDFADGELAWTSFDRQLKIFRWLWSGMMQGDMKNKETRFHPTQKPVQLYDYIFKNCTEPGQRVLDTHLGSGSSRISAHKYGLNFTGFEICEDYFLAQEDRFQSYQIQLNLFNK